MTFPAIISPAAEGTKEMLPGMALRLEAGSGTESGSGTGFKGSSLEYSTSKRGIPRFFNSFRITLHRGQTEVL